jgi:hypothetical protein
LTVKRPKPIKLIPNDITIFHVQGDKPPNQSGLDDFISINYREAFLPPSSRGHTESSVVKQCVDSEYARLSWPNSYCENAKTPGGIQLQ